MATPLRPIRDVLGLGAIAGIIAVLPVVAAALYVVFRVTTPIVINSKAKELAVIAVIAGTLGAVAVAAIVSFVVGRLVEVPLRAPAPRLRALSSPIAPFVAGGV